MSTYTPIASQTLSSAAASVTFSGIPQNYTDLRIAIQARSTAAGNGRESFRIRFNGDTGSNYSATWIVGNGTSAGSSRNSSQTYAYAMFQESNSTSTAYGMNTLDIMNYSNSTTYKTGLTRSSYNLLGNTEDCSAAHVFLWRSTSAITSIEFSTDASGGFSSGSTFNLYGIANAGITNTAKATGGDSVYTDGTYWYHSFLSSGAFVPAQNLTVDYLVVGGGGGGGVGGNGSSAYGGGGGGAGGVRCTVGATGGGGSLESALSLTASTNYPVLIGGGGSGTGNGRGYSGSPTTFSTITSAGGGGGGGTNPDYTGSNGGSGGGSSLGGSASSGTANQGYGGGTASSQGGAGGGGAGAAGSNAGGNNGAAGGNGIQTSISGTATYYGGGGGGGGTGTGSSTGGAGGLGGGGTGSASTGTYTPAQDNTGGGGYGGNNARGSSEKGGGSGVVIIRYAV